MDENEGRVPVSEGPGPEEAVRVRAAAARPDDARVTPDARILAGAFAPPPIPTQPSSPPQPSIPAQPPHRGRAGAALVAVGLALLLGLAAGGAALYAWPGAGAATTSGLGEDSTSSRTTNPSDADRFGSGQLGGTDPRQGWDTGTTTPDATTPDTAAAGATAASEAQQVGLVTIVTTLGYSGAKAAGTGIVLTADGEILTNNHVIDGATQIEVTVESTGEVYSAEVVGTDATADVAVLRLENASGLSPASMADGGVAVGDAITAVGNAAGGGDLLAAAGTVTALGESITTQGEGVSQGQNLTDLIQIDADVVSGDSGGAVLDAAGDVVGMTTAASSGTISITGYAIPIGDALDVAARIIAGVDTPSITIGYPGFLGVQLAGTSRTTFGLGAAIAGVYAQTPAADAGLAAGDAITALGGVAVDSAATLGELLGGYSPGDRVSMTWTVAATGATQTATVTLIAGPAD